MLKISNLAKAYPRKELWSGITTTIPKGTVVAITGPSGCGKSTLLNCLGTLEAPDSGTIEFDGHIISRLSSRRRRIFRATTLGYIAQDYALMESERVDANVAVALSWSQRRNKKKLIRDALKAVGLSGYERFPAYQLSGGEQQRVAIARLHVRQPSLILADEPTGSLDEANANSVMQALRDKATAGAVVVISTHDHNVVAQCDEVLTLT